MMFSPSRVFAALMLVGIAAAAGFLAPEARASQAALTKVKCNGAKCGGVGPEQYRYEVTPGTNGCSAVEVGLHQIVSVSNVVMPSSWSVNVISGNLPDKTPPFTVHGNFSANNGTCPLKLRFAGPSQAAPFVLGYDCNPGPHDVGWQTSDGAFANWGKPVGKGQGPIHSPTLDS